MPRSDHGYGAVAAPPRPLGRTLLARTLRGLLLAGAAACSALPAPELPPFRDHHVAAEFVVAADGRLPLPASSHRVLVHAVRLDPAPLGERFGTPGGLPPARPRRTATDDGDPPAPFGADRVTDVRHAGNALPRGGDAPPTRWFLYDPGTRVSVDVRFRAWAADGAPPVDARTLFPGALELRELGP